MQSKIDQVSITNRKNYIEQKINEIFTYHSHHTQRVFENTLAQSIKNVDQSSEAYANLTQLATQYYSAKKSIDLDQASVMDLIKEAGK